MKVYFFNYHSEKFEEEENAEESKNSEYSCVKGNRWVKADIAEEILAELIRVCDSWGNMSPTTKKVIQRATGKEIMNEADRWLSLCKNSIQLK